MNKYNKNEIKESLTIDDIFILLSDFHGEPIRIKEDIIISKTICHHSIEDLSEASHKLYYYDNTRLFCCYTGCAESTYDIFELVRKVKSIELGYNFSLFDAIKYVAIYFGYTFDDFDLEEEKLLKEDWDKINRYKNIEVFQEPKIELNEYDNKILNFLPHPRIVPWIKEGISQHIMNIRGICFDPSNYGVVIPHYDSHNKLIGIRERTLIKENEIYGKYRPAYLCGQLYNHPLGFNLYNLNNSKNNIKVMQKAIVFESEKSTLLYASIFGEENDLSVATCGSSVSYYQIKLLLNAGAKEIIIAYDKQFKEIGDEEFKRWTKKLQSIHDKYSSYCTISFMFDKFNLLRYKSSPIDEGREKFLTLFEKRIFLEGTK